MLQARNSRTPRIRALLGGVLRLLLLPLAVFVSPFLASARAQTPSTVGVWSGIMDWYCDHNATCSYLPLQHGALIPHGPYRGCVLMWSHCTNVSSTFLWMPDNPTRLFHIPSFNRPFGRDVGGISMTWDDEGQLVVVGSSVTAGSPGNETWRFFPSGLTYPPFATVPPPTTPCSQSNAQVGGTPWRTNAPMSLSRYQSTLLALCKGTIFGGVASGSCFVVGGTTSTTVNDGLEFWQALSPRSTIPGGSAWSQTFISNFTSPPHAPPPGLTEQYVPQGALTQPAQVQHETTPAAFQLADAGSGPNQFLKSIFVAHDTNAVYSATLPPGDPSGVSWFVRPRYTGTPATWEIWDGPVALQDRNRGTAFLRHDLAGSTGFSGKNRVISVGGTTFNVSANGWVVNDAISEYAIQTGQSPRTGTWSNKSIPGVTQIGRVDNSAVVLPTGDFLIVGGGIFAGSLPAPVPGTAQHTPQLVRPGPAGSLGSAWSVTNMAPSSAEPFYGGQIPRRRGHAAVLLPDGRVFVAGGDYPTPTEYTGEIFSPPYLFQGFRPSIVTVSASELDFGAPFTVDVGRDQGEVIDTVILVRPASLVFGFDTSQRYIELDNAFASYDPVSGIEVRSVTAPSTDLGPPGYYMLFVVS